METNKFQFRNTGIEGLYSVDRETFEDSRGQFGRLYCAREFSSVTSVPFVQVNLSVTLQRGMIRGLHYLTPPLREKKYISCIRGSVFDVVVDIRRNSKTFLAWHGEILDSTRQNSIYIPEGFAHGFQALEDDCELLYFHSDFYDLRFEGGLDALDERLDIAWPLPVKSRSDRGANLPSLGSVFLGVEI